MAGPFDFTGQNIEDTYQRLVQVSGSGFCDGTGSAISIGGSQNLQQVTDQGSTTTNAVTVGNLKLTGTEIQNTTDPNNKIEISSTNINLNSIVGDVVVNSDDNTGTSFIVKGDGDPNLMYVDGDNLKVGIGTNSPGHKLSVNGNVSASRLVAGQVAGFIYEEGGANSQDGALFWDRANKRFIAQENLKLSNTHLQARTNEITLQATEAGLTLSGSMNLKGDITASGVIRAFSFVNDSDTTKGLNLRGAGTEITGALDVTQDITAVNITASGDISSSNNLYANYVNANKFILNGSDIGTTFATKSNPSLTGNVTISGNTAITGSVAVDGDITIEDGHDLYIGDQDNINFAHGLAVNFGSIGAASLSSKKHLFIAGGGGISATSLRLYEDTEAVFFDNSGISDTLLRDFRVEGKDDTHLLFTTGSTARVGIGTSTPNEKLSVEGNISASGELIGIIDGGTF